MFPVRARMNLNKMSHTGTRSMQGPWGGKEYVHSGSMTG